MLDYVLAWLAANNVDEVFVFCCAHAELVMEHVEKYGGRLAGGAALHTVVSTACTPGSPSSPGRPAVCSLVRVRVRGLGFGFGLGLGA